MLLFFQRQVADLPPLQFHHPPSPGAPLNCIQRIRSRSREDIEGGGHAPDHVPLDGRAARRRRQRRRRIAAAVVRREGHYSVSGVIAERGSDIEEGRAHQERRATTDGALIGVVVVLLRRRRRRRHPPPPDFPRRRRRSARRVTAGIERIEVDAIGRHQRRPRAGAPPPSP